MPEPTYQEPNWAAKGSVLNSQIRMEGGFGVGGVGVGQQRVQRVLFENGEIWDIPDEGPAQKVDEDPDTTRRWQAAQKAEESEMPSPYRFKSEAGDIYEHQPMAPGQQGPPQPPRKIFSEPSAIERARDQHYGNISTIRDMLVSGSIDEAQADRMIGMSRQYMETTMRGATPWEIEKTGRSEALQQQRLGLDWEDLGFRKQKQKEDTASGLVSDRLRTGTSLAETLINTIVKSYRNTPSSTNPPYSMNPFRMARSYVDEMGAGQELSDMAKAILRGAMGGQ